MGDLEALEETQVEEEMEEKEELAGMEMVVETDLLSLQLQRMEEAEELVVPVLKEDLEAMASPVVREDVVVLVDQVWVAASTTQAR